ncbi:ribokinase, partial [bacterium]|nr:ribokinase [bacterium]
MKIVVVGSSNTDMIVRVSRIPKPGETVIGGTFAMAAGGKGANQAVAAARAGGRVTFIARVGNDLFGGQAVRGFRKDRIQVRPVIRDRKNASGVALIFVDAGGENSIAVASGANSALCPKDVLKNRSAFAGADILLMQLEVPLETVAAAADLAFRRGIPVILNPAPARKLPLPLMRKISILTPNEHEAGFLAGMPVRSGPEARRAADKLRSKGIQTVLITLGPKGAYVASEMFNGMIPGFRVSPVDSTAAGDVFNGALAVALAEKKEIGDAVRFANAA